jgi:hypothetical protein
MHRPDERGHELGSFRSGADALGVPSGPRATPWSRLLIGGIGFVPRGVTIRPPFPMKRGINKR